MSLQCDNLSGELQDQWSSSLCLYRPVCVEPVPKPHCWFSHKAAQILVSHHCILCVQENLRKKSPSPSSRNVPGARPLQSLGNLQLQNPTAAIVTPDTHKTRLDLFVEVHFLMIYKSHIMRKPTICIGENKDADQLRGNREADQRLCFRYSDSIILRTTL